ncbi:hypothetical protein G9A89_015180 [Geosiphon pyriformis]|nr:hypothetical protein G9A89_015180 [Geosiphon pyriformis]
MTPVMQKSTSKETIDSKDQVERNIASTTDKRENNTTIPNTTTVEPTRLTTPLFRFVTVDRPFGSVDTSSKDDTPFRIVNTLKRTALYRRAADFSLVMTNRLEKKTNKKYRHIRRISVKNLTERFNQVIKEDLFENTTGQTDNFVLQPMFNKRGNSNKFQIKA